MLRIDCGCYLTQADIRAAERRGREAKANGEPRKAQVPSTCSKPLSHFGATCRLEAAFLRGWMEP